MKRDDAKRIAKLALGNPITFNDEDLVDRLANAITDERDTRGLFTPETLKRRLRSFVDRCANVRIKTIGEFLIHPISKV